MYSEIIVLGLAALYSSFSSPTTYSLQAHPVVVMHERYRISGQALDFESAERSCQGTYGLGWGLASIQDEEEWTYLETFLASNKDMLREEFWIGGFYIPEDRKTCKGHFEWTRKVNEDSSDHMRFADFLNNKFSRDFCDAFSVSRSVLYMQNKTSAALSYAATTLSRRYICAITPNLTPIPCGGKVDIIALLDSSIYGFNVTEWENVKKFTKTMILPYAELPEARQGVISFASKIEEVLYIQYTPNIATKEIMSIIDTAPYLNGKATRTGAAVEYAAQRFRETKDHEARQVLVILVGSKATDRSKLQWEIEKVKSAGVIVMAIGVGNNVAEDEIRMLATRPTFGFVSSDWEKVIAAVNLVASKMCPQPVPPPNSPSSTRFHRPEDINRL